MDNNVENKNLQSTEKVYYDINNIHGEMLRYKTNSLSYKLGFGGILFSILGAFICLNTMTWGAEIIIKILGNIMILLFGFLSLEKAKAYSRTYSYVLIGIGGICIARMFWIPIQIITWYQRYLVATDEEKTEILNHLGATIVKPYITDAFLPQNGYFRGISAMVLLGIAAAFFIGAGVYGVIKAKQYADYMKDQDVSKGV
ncbi:MAG: hypothetical protein K2K48_05640 [Anaeroplasmataceae bacterium]|nr:hypothetical protein [Anaeroplasmataceae bacterium]MDE6414877.1 hypothetical protein [Anaeroplasmataceae bacterium]